MPELPEVETVRRGLAPHIEGQRFTGARVRQPRLRWQVPEDLDERLAGQLIHALTRRGKYLLFQLDNGGLISHLGMSGSLRLLTPRLADTPPGPHDHLDLLLENGAGLRYRTPVGPVRFDAAWDPRDDLGADQDWAMHLTVGFAF